jgi:hypothetical protein
VKTTFKLFLVNYVCAHPGFMEQKTFFTVFSLYPLSTFSYSFTNKNLRLVYNNEPLLKALQKLLDAISPKAIFFICMNDLPDSEIVNATLGHKQG